jgi:hypothetical protein
MTYGIIPPDTLRYIWFHLWPNAYKNTETAFAKQQLENGNTINFIMLKKKTRDYISGLDFTVNGYPAALQYDSVNIDISEADPSRSAITGSEISIATPFTVKIPIHFFHAGACGPIVPGYTEVPQAGRLRPFRVAPMPYLDQGEFYSEYGSFDVSITLPKNYVVGAPASCKQKKSKPGWTHWSRLVKKNLHPLLLLHLLLLHGDAKWTIHLFLPHHFS